MPDIDVLLPARDPDARHFAIALKSTLRSLPIERGGVDFGVVVVDHGSAVPLAGLRVVDDPRVTVVRVDVDVPFAVALERGRARCTAPFIARMDADDVMHPLRLAEDTAALRAPAIGAGLGAVSSRVKVLPKASTLMRGYVGWQNGILSAPQHKMERWIEQPICNPATTYRNSAINAAGGWQDHPWPEDYDLFLRLMMHGYDVIKRPVVRHAWRQHFGQLTRTTKARKSRDALAACKACHLGAAYGLSTRPVLVLGAGKEGRRISRALRAAGVVVAGFVDVDVNKIGRVVHGVPVVAQLPMAGSGVFVVGAVGTSGARGPVRGLLQERGYVEDVDAVVVA